MKEVLLPLSYYRTQYKNIKVNVNTRKYTKEISYKKNTDSYRQVRL